MTGLNLINTLLAVHPLYEMLAALIVAFLLWFLISIRDKRSKLPPGQAGFEVGGK